MRIRQLELLAFGRFCRRTVELGPGLNLIYGPNEAGKSTVQAFLLGMLFGLPEGALGRERLVALQRYQPWQGHEYGGELLYELQDGRSYRVQRSFQPPDVHVFDARTGLDVTHQYPRDSQGDVAFAAQQLGLSRAMFLNTAWIGQAQTDQVDLLPELLQRLAQEATAAHGPASYAPPGLQRLLAEKETEFARAQAGMERLQQWALELQQAQYELAELEQRMEVLRWHLRWCNLADAERRLTRARSLHLRAVVESGQANSVALASRMRQVEAQREAVLAELGPLRRLLPFGADASRRLTEVVATLQALDTQILRLNQETERLRQQVTQVEGELGPQALHAAQERELMKRIEELEREIAALRPKANAKALVDGRREAEDVRDELRQVGGGLWLVMGTLLAAVTGALATQPGLTRGLLPAWLPGGYLTLVLVAGSIGLVFWVLGGRGLVRRAKIARALRAAEQALLALQGELEGALQQIALLEARRDTVLQRANATSVQALQQRLLQYQQAELHLEGLRRASNQVHGQLAALQSDRQALLAPLAEMLAVHQGVQPPMANLGGAAIADCRQALQQLQELRGRWEAHTAELHELTERRQAEQARCTEAERLLGDLLAQAGAQRIDDVVLGGDSEADLAADVALLREQLIADGRAEPVEPLEADSVWAELAQQQAEQARLMTRTAELTARVEATTALLPDADELGRQLQELRAARVSPALLHPSDWVLPQAREQVAATTATVTVVDTAVDTVRLGAPDFYPRLGGIMGRLVQRLTAGHYQQVQVDEHLGLRVRTGEQGWVEVGSLSGATVDQVYFALRLALLELRTAVGEPVPLLLDDPFVQYDEERLRAALAVLATRSRMQQVIWLTSHERDVAWARQALAPEPLCLIDLGNG